MFRGLYSILFDLDGILVFFSILDLFSRIYIFSVVVRYVRVR